MEINEFAEKVQKAVAQMLGESYEVGIREVCKNNGVVLVGLTIRKEYQNVTPTIYLEPFLEAYEEGTPLLEVIRRIVQIYRDDTPKESLDMKFFEDFAEVKDRICYRLIHAEKNAELLGRIPYIPFLDLAICFYYAYTGEELGSGSILIHNTHMEMWNTGISELMHLAGENTSRIFPMEFGSMESILKKCVGEKADAQQFPAIGDAPLYVLSNRQRIYGASCILYADLLKRIGDGIGADFYILPSSVHEVILLADKGIESAEQLKKLIREVNATQLEPEEVLSDSLYFYDRAAGQIKIV